MRSYGQFCPVAKATEVFAERWTPLILRELLLGTHAFTDLHRGVPLMSRTLLAQRLEALTRAGVVERRARTGGRGWSYPLTAAGEEFRDVIWRLGAWGQRWARRRVERGGDLDPGLLM
jgi:DNA-binding HxlR family transcriptional regulator